jgi:hypothetical protein
MPSSQTRSCRQPRRISIRIEGTAHQALAEVKGLLESIEGEADRQVRPGLDDRLLCDWRAMRILIKVLEFIGFVECLCGST